MLMRFRATQGFKPTFNVQIDLKEAYFYPLLFAPGEKWSYGVGIDWAGWMVERVNSNMPLDSYIQKNIWDPLSVKSMTFFPKKNQATSSKLTDMSIRSGDITMFGTTANPTGKLGHTNDRVWNMETIGCSGGSGSYGAPLDYHKMLHSILTDDGKLLKKETVDEMFKPSLTSTAQKSLMELLKIPEINQAMGGLPMGTKVDYGLSGIIALEGVPGGREKGAMAWVGYPNLFWWIDRVGGISGIYGTQVVPPGDPKAIEIRAAWEKEIYRKAGKQKL
jgi:CubicO group peptidase (beta-lactamase class C family)